MPDPVVRVSSLNFSFGEGTLRRQVLHEVSLTIEAGEIVILEGPSGSGKTTLLTLLSGLRSFQDGSIQLFGNELCGASPQVLMQMRRRIGYIFQHHNLLNCLTARRNVEIMFELQASISSAEARARTEQMLSQVGLQDQMESLPATLSGGQRQRVAIARALVTSPSLILADEPTASLDKTTGRQVVELLQKVSRAKSIPILMVTHDHRILDIADRTLRMEDGKLIETACPAPH
ncbi:MAG: ATP-binding cassette domain-containing protein [Pirellula sp.]